MTPLLQLVVLFLSVVSKWIGTDELVSTLFKFIEGRLSEYEKNREQRTDEKFKQAVADGDMEYAAYLLDLRNKQLRHFREQAKHNNPSGQQNTP